jgi:hypothetical protein
MNAGSPHLDLDELLAEVNGEMVSDRTWVHLSACRACQAEVKHWQSVAAGVRHLVAVAPVPPRLPSETLAGMDAYADAARYSTLRHARLWALAGAGGQPRRVLVAVAAAVALAAGAVSYGLTGGSGSGHSGPATAAGLIAVNGCSGLVAGLGTVVQLNGASLIVRTPGDQPVTVTTSASTDVSREVTGSVGDITDGARVFLRGIYARGRVTARSVSIGVAPKLPAPGLGRLRHARARPWIGVGTVRDAGEGSFILVVPGGTRVPVAAPSSTIVFSLVRADLNQFRTGDYVVAVGKAGPGGTLLATTVEEGTSLPHSRSNGISGLPRLGCATSAVATAALISAS